MCRGDRYGGMVPQVEFEGSMVRNDAAFWTVFAVESQPELQRAWSRMLLASFSCFGSAGWVVRC